MITEGLEVGEDIATGLDSTSTGAVSGIGTGMVVLLSGETSAGPTGRAGAQMMVRTFQVDLAKPSVEEFALAVLFSGFVLALSPVAVAGNTDMIDRCPDGKENQRRIRIERINVGDNVVIVPRHSHRIIVLYWTIV